MIVISVKTKSANFEGHAGMFFESSGLFFFLVCFFGDDLLIKHK